MTRSEILEEYRKAAPAQQKIFIFITHCLLPIVLIAGYADRFWSELKSLCWHVRQEGRIVIEEHRAFIEQLKIITGEQP